MKLDFIHEECRCGTKLCPCYNDKEVPRIKSYEGYYYEETSPGLHVLRPCDKFSEYSRKHQVFLKFKKSNIPDSIIKYEIEKDYLGNKSLNTIELIKKYFKYFCNTKNKRLLPYTEIAKKAILYFYGDNGTQKTHVAHWLLKELLFYDFNVYYTTMQDLTKLLVDTVEVDEKEKELIDFCLNCDLLVIDEAFDKSKMTLFKSAYQIPFLDSFIRNRIQKEKATIFISNVLPENISKLSEKTNEGVEIMKSLSDLIQRNIQINNSLLVFEDNYIKEVERIKDRIVLF
jgi:DNA replication protein DnaC